MIIIRPSSTLKFGFVYGFNKSLGAVFSLYTWMWLFWSHLLPMTVNEKLSAKAAKYISKCWKRAVKRKSKFNFIRVIKNSSFDQHFIYIYITLTFQHFLLTNSCSPLRIFPCHHSSLFCKTWNISTLSMFVYYNTEAAAQSCS